MSNKFDMMAEAMDEATDTQRAADAMANRMAIFLVGRLRKVNNVWALHALKRELKDFDMRDRRWVDRT